MARNKVRSTRLSNEHEAKLQTLLKTFDGTAHKLVSRCLEYGLEAAASGIDVFARTGSQDPVPAETVVPVEPLKDLTRAIERLAEQSVASQALALNNALDNFEIINWLRMIGETMKPGHTDDIEKKITGRGQEVMRIACTLPLNAPTAP